MREFSDYCKEQDTLNEDWRDLWSAAKEKAKQGFNKANQWWQGQEEPEEKKWNIGGRKVGLSDVKLKDPYSTRRKINPEDRELARSYANETESRMKKENFLKALRAYGYAEDEVDNLINNAEYVEKWDNYLRTNPRFRSVYASVLKQNQSGTAQHILKMAFDTLFGKNVIPIPALLVKQPSEVMPEKREVIALKKLKNDAVLLLRSGTHPDEVIKSLLYKYAKAGINFSSLKGLARKAVNIARDELAASGKLGPRRIAPGTNKAVVPEPQAVPQSPLRLYQ
jgi:hypothetical protein